MKRILNILSIFLLTASAYGQDPYVDAGPDTLTCPPDCLDLTADFYGTGSTSDYTVESIDYAPDVYIGTAVFLGDDSGISGLSIGFDFCFYGETFSTFCISPNGWIGFGALVFTYTPTAIPTVAVGTPKNAIMGPWHDLNPSLGGSITYATAGVAPFRRLVVTWDAIPHFSCGPGTESTQQIIIYESTNIIETHIPDKKSCLGWVGGNATQGVHNADGTLGVPVPGRNNTVWTLTEDAVRYTPIGEPIIEWYEDDLLIAEGPDVEVCPDVATTYVVKLFSCGVEIAVDSIFVDIECCDPPIMSFTEPSCFGECDGTATAEGVGIAPYTYLWDAAAGDQTTPTAVGLCSGTYEVEVTDAEGCTTTTPITVTEPDEITADTTITGISCFGEIDGAITIEGLGGTGVYTYDIGAGPVPVGEFTDLAPGTYTITIEDDNGCTGVFDIDIIEPDVMGAVIDGVSDVLCNGEANGEIIVNGIGGSGVYEFSMDGGAFVPSGTFTGLAIGTYNFVVVDENGCSDTVSAVVNEPPVLTLDVITATDVTCFEGSDGLIEVLGGGGFGALTYSFDGGGFTPVATLGGLTLGTYNITVRDANGCEESVDVELTEGEEITAFETVLSETCFEDCMGSIEIEVLTGLGPFVYSIDGCATTSIDPNFSGLCAGDYDICVVSAAGCDYFNTVTIEVGAPPSDATILSSEDNLFCLDDEPTTLWADSPGGIFTGAGMVDDMFYPGLAGTGVHTITYTISEGCGDIGTYEVEVFPLPYIAFSTTDLSGCEPLTVNFNYEGEPGIDCVWDFGDGVAYTCGPVTHIYEDDAIYDVSLTVTTSLNNCKSTLTKFEYIEVYNQPIADFDFSPQPTTSLRTEIAFTDLSFGPEYWDWYFDTEGTSSEQNPSFLFPINTADNYNVMLVVSNEDGCVDSIEKTVIIAEEYLIYVPNTITPDGDLFNEVFKPYFNGIDVYNYSLRIYNRWGELLFESYDPSVGWNGTYGGEVVEDGVYIWHISTDETSSDRKIEYYGHVTVLR